MDDVAGAGPSQVKPRGKIHSTTDLGKRKLQWRYYHHLPVTFATGCKLIGLNGYRLYVYAYDVNWHYTLNDGGNILIPAGIVGEKVPADPKWPPYTSLNRYQIALMQNGILKAGILASSMSDAQEVSLDNNVDPITVTVMDAYQGYRDNWGAFSLGIAVIA